MVNIEDLTILKRGVDEWNRLRLKYPQYVPDLSDAMLAEENLYDADLTSVNLSGANLYKADLSCARLDGAYLISANLSKVKLGRASLRGAWLNKATLRGADITGADLTGAHLIETQLARAILRKADLTKADLSGADLRGANLSKAVLSGARLVETNFFKADLSGCRVYGISAWDLDLTDAIQSDLIYTAPDQGFELKLSDLQMAQFMYFIMSNVNLRDTIDTLTTKIVLILGRFTKKQKQLLEIIRTILLQQGYVPVLFDFKKPESRDLTETVSFLAGMSRFIIADLSAPKSIPQELGAIIPNMPSVPVLPLLMGGEDPYSMFEHWTRYPWVLPIVRYTDAEDLFFSLDEQVFGILEQKVKDAAPQPFLQGKRVIPSVEKEDREQNQDNRELDERIRDPHGMITDEEIDELDGNPLNLTAEEAWLLQRLDSGDEDALYALGRELEEVEESDDEDDEMDEEEVEDISGDDFPAAPKWREDDIPSPF